MGKARTWRKANVGDQAVGKLVSIGISTVKSIGGVIAKTTNVLCKWGSAAQIKRV